MALFRVLASLEGAWPPESASACHNPWDFIHILWLSAYVSSEDTATVTIVIKHKSELPRFQ
jgi:hypothetical protein